MQGRGELLWEYRPPRAHPIVYAGLIVFAVVFLMGAAENLLRDNRPVLYAIYAGPVVATLAFFLLWFPSPTRLYKGGVAPSRPLVLRWWHPFLPWEQLAAVYPASYDVTGAFVSPFASSDGKVTQTGLALEAADGRTHVVRFTPTRFAMNSRRSRGYREAIEVVRAVFAEQGRPLAPQAEAFSAAERDDLLARARAPFLPFFVIVVLFASAAPALWLLLTAHVPLAVALPVALVAPLATSVQSWRRSRMRNSILNRLSKAAEHERESAGVEAPA